MSGESLENILEQAKHFQQTLKDIQNQLNDVTIVGEAGDKHKVRITFNGNEYALSVKIDDGVYQEGRKVLYRLICGAINDAKKKAERLKGEKMKGVASELGLPSDLEIPFDDED